MGGGGAKSIIGRRSLKGESVLINVQNNTDFIMTFSYGRALQQSALKHWSKNIEDIKGTEEVFNNRAKMCSLAARGKWSYELDNK